MEPVDVRTEIAQLEIKIKEATREVQDNNTYHNRVLLQQFVERRSVLIQGLRNSFKLVEGGLEDESAN